MKKIFNLDMAIYMLAGMSILSCADDESRSSLAGDATVIINLGLPPEYETANASIIDRVLRFFTRDAVAAPAPAAFGTISVRISGADIGIIEQTFPGSDSVSMQVPSGSLRTFEVTAFVAPYDADNSATWTAALSYRGVSRANIPSGKTVYIPVRMEINETKLLVPDLRNQRLVLLNSVSSTGWNDTRIASELGLGGTLIYPYDIDYDARGRIYIANWVSSIAEIIRIDHINGGNPAQYDIGSTTFTQPVGIAIDRKRDLLYCISSTELYRCPLSNIAGGATRLDASNLIWSNMFGIDVDEDGNLYLVNSGAAGGACITKYDPVANSIIYQLNTFPSLSGAYDIKIQKPFLYVLNSNGAAGYQVLKYRIDAEGAASATYTLVDHYGTKTVLADLTNGMFYGPRKFVGIRNDGLFVIDNNEPSYLCKMVWLGNFPALGASWSAFGAWGTGASYFKFYCSC